MRSLGERLREPVNALTHLVGAVLATAGAAALLVLSRGDVRSTVAFAIYGVSLVLLYVASTLHHAVRGSARVERALKLFDHAAIYVLIAGTYTPVAMVALHEARPGWAWSILATVWILAAAGVAAKLAVSAVPRWLSTALYLGLGWLAIVAIGPLIEALPWPTLSWLAAGGVAYTAGAVVYARRSPDPMPGIFGYHELWHLFVLAGSACHFVALVGLATPV